ncbi:hypothetical protein B0H11DRAFT_2201599 [Mycena galericulata]|nr:hypothetical protein B0H11DRAFT_2201599 [Mycena galericulata]
MSRVDQAQTILSWALHKHKVAPRFLKWAVDYATDYYSGELVYSALCIHLQLLALIFELISFVLVAQKPYGASGFAEPFTRYFSWWEPFGCARQKRMDSGRKEVSSVSFNREIDSAGGE